MAKTPTAALAELFHVPTPTSVSSSAPAFGSDREQNSRMADLIVGPAPAGEAARAQWRKDRRATMRNLQRWRNTTGERRRPSAAQRQRLAPVFRAARTFLQGQRYADIRRRGVKARIVGWVQVSRTKDHVTMPADVAGRRSYTPIPPPDTRPIVDRWAAGEHDVAAAELLGAFFRHYWPDDPAGVTYLVEIDDVEVLPL